MFRKFFGVVKGIFITTARVLSFPIWLLRRRKPLLISPPPLSDHMSGGIPEVDQEIEEHHVSLPDASEGFPIDIGDDGIDVLDLTIPKRKGQASSSQRRGEDMTSTDKAAKQGDVIDTKFVKDAYKTKLDTEKNIDKIETIVCEIRTVASEVNLLSKPSAKVVSDTTLSPMNETFVLKEIIGAILENATCRTGTLTLDGPDKKTFSAIEAPIPSDSIFVQVAQIPILEPSSPVSSFIPSLPGLSTLAQPSITILGSGLSRTLHQEAAAATPDNNGDMNDRAKKQGTPSSQPGFMKNLLHSDEVGQPEKSNLVVKKSDKSNETAGSKGSRNSKKTTIATSGWESVFGDTPRQSVTPRRNPNKPVPSLDGSGPPHLQPTSLLEKYSSSFSVGSTSNGSRPSRRGRPSRRANKRR